ncbi:MAG UNVERIFIED_CONTAM: hypothetical protein LVR18_01120 [Planctomycetaceae bacterium]
MGNFTNQNLNLTWDGFNRIELIDAARNLTLTGATDGAAISLGDISLGIVAQSLNIPVDVTADDFEVNVRDSLTLAHQLSVHELDLRVFGNQQGLTITQPISTDTIQLVAPDGTVSLPGGTRLTGTSAVIKARQLVTSSGQLTLSLDTLTLLVRSTSATDALMTNDRDLLLTNKTDSDHLVTLGTGIAAVFAGITWIADVAAEWSEQVFDGAANPYALAVSGLIDITLPPVSGNDEDTLTVQGGLRSWTGSISITADEADFLGGAASVKAPGSLTIKASTDVWTYRLGTSAETGGGGVADPLLAPEMFDLNTRDLAALADGFQHITFGRSSAGNLFRLGDAFNMTTVKATGAARIVDAGIKDPLTLLTDSLIVEGDFRAPLDPITITATTAEIRKVNLHTPNNSNPDSGLTASSLTLNLQTALQVGGWLAGTADVAISVPAAAASFGIITDVGTAIRQTGNSGSLSITTNTGIRVAGQIVTAAAWPLPRI